MKIGKHVRTDSEIAPVKPVRPAAGYIGGKRSLAKRLVKRIAETPHSLYAEAFIGMGGVFLRRTARPKVEVINDWSEDVATFFRVLQHHYVAFLDMLRFQVTSRANFERLVAQNPNSLTDMQRAARFLYLQKLAFGGKVAGRGFGGDYQNGARFDVTKLGPVLEALHERLAGVSIERMRWQDFIRRYDRPGTLFYLDPPYFGCENDYGEGLFGREEFAEMATMLRTLRGSFILSINDRPEIRRAFEGFEMEEVAVRYQLAGMAKSRSFGELIISA